MKRSGAAKTAQRRKSGPRSSSSETEPEAAQPPAHGPGQPTSEWVLERLAIEAVREGEGSTHSGRVASLGTLARCLGMVRERMEHTVAQPPIKFTLTLDHPGDEDEEMSDEPEL